MRIAFAWRFQEEHEARRMTGETVRRAEMENLSVHRLRELADVDTEEDWLAFLKRADGG